MLFVTLAKSRMVAIEQALAAEKGFVSQTFYELVNDPILWISIQTRTAILLGIVFLKIAKPDLGGSVLIISVVIIPGLALALPMSRHRLTDLCQLLALRRICLAERGDGAVHSYAIPLDAFLDVGFLPQTEARIVCSINPLYSTEICHLIAGTKWRK